MSGGRTGHRWVALLIPLVGLAWGCSPNAAGNTNPTSKTTGAPATSGTSGTTGAPATPASTANPVASAATVISATGSAPTLPAISSDVATSTTAVGVVVFAGSGDFYDVATPLSSGRPGQVIRVQPVTDTRIVNALVLRVAPLGWAHHVHHRDRTTPTSIDSRNTSWTPATSGPPLTTRGWARLGNGLRTNPAARKAVRRSISCAPRATFLPLTRERVGRCTDTPKAATPRCSPDNSHPHTLPSWPLSAPLRPRHRRTRRTWRSMPTTARGHSW